MKLKLYEIAEVSNVAASLDRDLPATVAWKVARLIRAFEPELKDYNEARSKVFQDHGKDVDGQLAVSDPKAIQELKDLGNQEVEINAAPIPLEDLPGDFSVAVMHALFPVIASGE